MGNFSRDTFNELKHYVGVRLQQGVPIVDADWNELEDIRRYELRSFIKWFIGDGVPLGNDGFRIYSVNKENDFGILGGDGTAEKAGRCLVDGLEAIIENDTTYKGQVDDYMIPTEISSLTTPAADRTDIIYLDVWEREVDNTEDPSLVNARIGVETCVRTRREWVVRVAENAAAAPAPESGHCCYPLASLSRKAGEGKITAGMIKDLRRTGLTLRDIVDADLISRVEDLEYYEQMLKKWYIGNGAPNEDGGFEITAETGGRNNDFIITAGRCMVNGYDIESKADIRYSLQVADSSDLLKTPTSNQKLLVYLDAWKEDGAPKTCRWTVKVRPWLTLELPPIYLPTFILYRVFDAIAPKTTLRSYAPVISARSAGYAEMVDILPAGIGFSWADIDSNNVPTVSDIEEMTAPEVEAYERDGHYIYPLAFIARESGNAKITDEMILDLRQGKLNLSNLTRRVENLESEVFFWDVTVTPEETAAFYGSPVEIDVQVDDAHGPRKGALVEFSTDYGTITPSSVVTNEFGRAKTTLVGTVLEETPTVKEILDLKGIHQVLKASFAMANPNVTSFARNVKLSSSQMTLLERHLPDTVFRKPLMDKAILEQPVREIPTKTATVNIRVKYSSERQITKGLGSTQVVFRQWIRPWLSYSVYGVFDTIRSGHIGKVDALITDCWDAAGGTLKAEFSSGLNAHMDRIQTEAKDSLVKNMVIGETSPSLGGIGEIVEDAIIDMAQETTVDTVNAKIEDTSGANVVIREALVTSNQALNLQRMKAALYHKKR